MVKSFYHNFDSSHTRDASNQTNSNNCFQEVQNVKLLMHVQDHLQQSPESHGAQTESVSYLSME